VSVTDNPEHPEAAEHEAEADAKEPRPEKVAVVTEVKERMSEAEAVILTEYRGLSVKELQSLRASLTEAGAVYKVYKNTLVRRAADELDWDLADLLVGPTAMAFVASDVGSAAKALTEFAKAQPLLVLKGGVMGGDVLDDQRRQGAGRPALRPGDLLQAGRPASTARPAGWQPGSTEHTVPWPTCCRRRSTAEFSPTTAQRPLSPPPTRHPPPRRARPPHLRRRHPPTTQPQTRTPKHPPPTRRKALRRAEHEQS
jgi:ribosomal protein L10